MYKWSDNCCSSKIAEKTCSSIPALSFIFDKLAPPLNKCFKRCFKSLFSPLQRIKQSQKCIKRSVFPILHFGRHANVSPPPGYATAFRPTAKKNRRHNALRQGRPTFISRGPNLLFQKFDGPTFRLSLSPSSQTKASRLISW